MLTVLRFYLTVSGNTLKGRSNVEKLLGNISMFYLELSILLMLFAELSARRLQRCGDRVSVCTLDRLLFFVCFVLLVYLGVCKERKSPSTNSDRDLHYHQHFYYY